MVPDSRPLDHLPLAGASADPAIALPRGESIDYAGLESCTGRLAAWLRAHCAQSGERVASWLPKGALAAILPLAAARAGLVYVPVNPLLKRAQVAHILNDSGAALLITQASRAALLEADDLAGAVLIEEPVASAAMVDEGAKSLPPSAADPADVCEILYTSGSTGRPKGVMLSHANLSLGAAAVADYLDMRPDDRTLCVLPFSFDYGQNQLFATWAAGGCAVPFDYLLPRDVAKAVGAQGITTLAGVPPLWVQLLDVEWPQDAAAGLRRLTNSGGALTRPMVRRLRERFANADLYAMYGLTEAFRSTYLPPALIDSHPDSMGRAIPHAEILVVRPDGSLTDADEPGELVHCGPLVAQGYWRDAARTAERFRAAPPASTHGGRAVWSGDTVRRDGQGLLYFVGRDDAMIKSAGNRISPTEIEEAAAAVPGVAEAVALGLPDARLGQAIRLYIRATGEESEVIAALHASLRRDLPNFMQPREIVALADLPRNPNGKLDRVALAQMVTP
ncbi:acyl-CoA ligase (AMP-forming), exosortase A system-associated [Sphingobium sufflavum]|uniref:acyl-CoA ligase (AMP-forming), exosortase A system-associated n=1 Tax=Sphingobium sufflavum TaxID=1129547 RepID=UPI001F2EC422|nr:acyl-CoA ligase (AMP-forming), exosortase A system-associated [Sphingobium sufflavum]MCE7797389.1 acyl-CoA ligase (AMP-forming), exosortase A system-associated [Sphingobium sufflavum]